MLTRLSLYNSPERVTSSLEEIPGPSHLPPVSFTPPPFYWKGGVGASVIVEHLSSSQLQRQSQLVDLWQHLPDAKPSNMLLIEQRALARIWRSKKRWSDGIHADGIWCEHLPSWEGCDWAKAHAGAREAKRRGSRQILETIHEPFWLIRF